MHCHVVWFPFQAPVLHVLFGPKNLEELLQTIGREQLVIVEHLTRLDGPRPYWQPQIPLHVLLPFLPAIVMKWQGIYGH